VLTATSGRLLRNVSVSLPDGLYAAAPAQLDAIAAGSESWITARASRAQIDGEVVLRGQMGTEPFEARYPVHLTADSSNASAFVPRLYAAERIADLEREGTDSAARSAAALSTRYHVASRYTSLLVLESEAMFTAFGLKRDFGAPSWNAESVAEGEVASAEPEALRSPGAPAKAGYDSLGSASGSAELEEKRFAAPPAAAPAAPRSLDAASGPERAKRRMEQPLEFEPPMRRQRPMIPMRKVWERVGQIRDTALTPSTATGNALAAAERLVQVEPDRREPVRNLYTLLARSGSLEAASRLVSSWLTRDPFDPDALTAHADLLARAGRREEAIEALGSVVDARPGDASALRRLERLLRWMGDAKLGCRYLVAAAELHTEDATLLADAVRCSRDTANAKQEAQLWLAASATVRELAEARLRKDRTDDALLLGDLRVEASWEGDADVDLGIIDPDGLRASFLGAPTRAVISAREVTARDREGLALRGGKPGEYVIEVVRAKPGSTSVRGTLRITAAGTTRTLPFTLYEQSRSVAVANIKMVSKLVPL
jgi:tetratricopeptide (TPR) repeat protein